MIALVALHFLVGLTIIAVGDRLDRRALVVAAVAPAAAVVWLLTQLGRVLDGRVVEQTVRWAPSLGIDLQFRLDGFGALMMLLVSGLGVAVFLYGSQYFPRRREGQARLIGLLTCFSGSMVGLVLADNLLLLVTFWELTAVTSFLLIGNDHTKRAARAAALQAILTTGLGGLAMLAGFILIGVEAGTFRLSELTARPPSGTPVTVGLFLALAGAAAKSAQYPFHAWLPTAMVAPTPVSAYLHSATMVKAGVYLLARLAVPFGDAPGFRQTAIAMGVVTMVVGGLRALRQTDLKVLLAFGTVSQLGFMFVLFGAGSVESVQAGCVLLLAHGLFKAPLFMAVGVLDHQLGTRDLRSLPTIGREWNLLRVVIVVSAASMAGVPLVFGFIAKEAAYESLVHLDGGWGALAITGAVIGSVLTFAYSARIVWGALVWPGRCGRPAPEPDTRPSPWFVAPAAVLAALTVVVGLVPGLLDGLVGVAVPGLAPGVLMGSPHFAIWHGVNTALLLSLATYAAGSILHRYGDRVAPVLALGGAVPSGAVVYRSTLRSMNRLADLVTGTVQSGSLPVYAGVVMLTAAVLPAAALWRGTSFPELPEFSASAGQVVLAALILGAGIGAAAVRRRFAAALFLGAAGYGMAGMFVASGAPDLALTQTAIETLTTVLFVLVLRRLPDGFERSRSVAGRPIRLAIAAAVGVTVFVFALVAGSERVGPPVSDEMIRRSVPDGGGRNVVNVILVDFRGFDTLGEITVLAAAAIGSVALARAGRKPGSAIGDEATDPAAAGATTTAPVVPVVRRVFNVDVSVSVIFYAMVMASMYLLFAGHNQPGGGFVGGLVAGAAIALRYVAGGIDEVRRISPLKPWTILGTGVVAAAVCAIVPVLFGHPVLENAAWSATIPAIGKVKVPSALVFDFGVYLVVIGLVLMVVEAFGERFAGVAREGVT